MKQWVVFCRHTKWNPLLITPDDVIPLAYLRKKEIEFKLCCFAAWLHKARPPLASGTVIGYVSHVRSQHSIWLDGESFNALIGATSRLTKLCKAIKKQRPKKLRLKKPFPIELIMKYYRANKHAIRSKSAATFTFTRNFAVMCIAYYQLCRLSELANTSPPSQANAHPIMMSDVRFFTKKHEEIPWPTSSGFTKTFWSQVGYLSTRYPPSKADPFAYNSDLFFPKPSAGAKFVTAFSAIKWLLTLYPIRDHLTGVVPLLRDSIRIPCNQVKASTFMGGFKAACRIADIQYAGYGTHCWRVAGMNRLGDLHAGPMVISAHGHWASDAWGDYSRRNQLQLMEWANRMAGGASGNTKA